MDNKKAIYALMRAIEARPDVSVMQTICDVIGDAGVTAMSEVTNAQVISGANIIANHGQTSLLDMANEKTIGNYAEFADSEIDKRFK